MLPLLIRGSPTSALALQVPALTSFLSCRCSCTPALWGTSPITVVIFLSSSPAPRVWSGLSRVRHSVRPRGALVCVVRRRTLHQMGFQTLYLASDAGRGSSRRLSFGLNNCVKSKIQPLTTHPDNGYAIGNTPKAGGVQAQAMCPPPPRHRQGTIVHAHLGLHEPRRWPL